MYHLTCRVSELLVLPVTFILQVLLSLGLDVLKSNSFVYLLLINLLEGLSIRFVAIFGQQNKI